MDFPFPYWHPMVVVVDRALVAFFEGLGRNI